MSAPVPYYQDDHATIYHADWRDVIDHINADVLVTDPPYGIEFRSNYAGRNTVQNQGIANDADTSHRDAVLERWGSKPALVFGTWKKPRPEGVRAILQWDKGTVGMGAMDVPWWPNTEEIYVLGKGWIGTRSSSVLHHSGRLMSERVHPTEKPLALLRELMAKCPPGVVLDPFMGSGSTLRAAKDFGRRCIGIELEERYCESAARRMCQEALDVG